MTSQASYAASLEEGAKKKDTMSNMREPDFNAAWGEEVAAPVPVPESTFPVGSDTPADSVRYKALFAFEARNPDELSFDCRVILLW